MERWNGRWAPNPLRRNNEKSCEILKNESTTTKCSVLRTRGVGKSEKKESFGNLPSPCKIVILFVIRLCYPLYFYYQFSCSIRILQSILTTSTWEVVCHPITWSPKHAISSMSSTVHDWFDSWQQHTATWRLNLWWSSQLIGSLCVEYDI